MDDEDDSAMGRRLETHDMYRNSSVAKKISRLPIARGTDSGTHHALDLPSPQNTLRLQAVPAASIFLAQMATCLTNWWRQHPLQLAKNCSKSV